MSMSTFKTDMPPLPPGNPPPLPPPGNGVPPAFTSQIPPPPMSTTPAAMTPQYTAYMQQYYQYYQYMYANPAMMQTYMAANPGQASGAIAAAAAANMQQYYNFPPAAPNTAATTSPLSSNNFPKKPNEQKKPPPAAQIKFNLKYQQEPQVTSNTTAQQVTASPAAAPVTQSPVVKKSRFDLTSNVASEQRAFTQQQLTTKAVVNDSIKITVMSSPLSSSSSSTSVAGKSGSECGIASEDTVGNGVADDQKNDTVYDIRKWPETLKAYCAKVYAHYQKLATVGDDQVTKYLQKRITEVFKNTPDLKIDWGSEPLPDVATIKRVSPFSEQQLNAQQQKFRQQKAAQAAAVAIANQKRLQQMQHAAAAPTLGQLAKQQSQSSKRKESIRKRRSSSSSSSISSSSTKSKSTSSSSSSSDKTKKARTGGGFSGSYIPLSSSTNKRKYDDNSDDDGDQYVNGVNLRNMTNKQRKRLLYMQRKNGGGLLKPKNGQAVSSNDNILIKKKKSATVNEPASRRIVRSFSELEKEQVGNYDQDQENCMNTICIGTNDDLEKEYLRLTGPPEACMIRPLDVLKRSLDYVLLKYSRTNDYRYICDQLKAIRQDLTVQMVKNEFTIEVYETHARLAIRNSDRDEFNQCQNQLKNLYLTVSSKSIDYSDNSAEFLGYRLIYNMLTKSYKDIDQVIREIKLKYSSNKYLAHLVELRSAWYLTNYIKFFKLYKRSNRLTKLLIDLFIERERKQALKCIIKALESVADMLAYESLEACQVDLTKYNLVLVEDAANSIGELYLDCKSCNLQNL